MKTFSIWTPMEIGETVIKTVNGGEETELTGRIGGIISTELKDQQGGTVLQGGIDWDYFLKHGWFNYEHKAGPDNVLGHPEIVETITHNDQPATRVEGVLYLHKARAKEIWETAQAMQKASTKRRLGFSVEGQVLGRDKKNIIKAKVLNVAITAHPVNPDARLEVLARSFSAVGYQTPTQPGVENLSPLVPQSLQGKPSIATFGDTRKKDFRKMSSQELSELLTRLFPSLDSNQALIAAKKIAISNRG